MSRLHALYGLPISRDYQFRLGGKKYRLGASGVRALTLLAGLVEQTPDRGDVGWLLRRRGDVREIERINPSAALILVVDRAQDDRLRCLAVWLRGRCGGVLGAATVSRLSTSTDRTLRKEAARCLRRLKAWAALRAIAEADPDPQIRALATQSPSVPFTTRLAGFSRRLSRRLASPATPGLWVSPDASFEQGRPPKPRRLIRLILERIHRLAAGTAR
ncbi:hypothetical protein Pla175_50380 [Pirellulimonas nuda]|uniref:Uncharacterized protein n=1 Tax=Pirellulimonas nuda TaxID=2528009 RepID=A0A518DJG0_9BACT|nr:HEAT repeat domain-containing protein [Pirellulimonas nuda]QDU91608.1 hypothetical protein Pla175_50380 [Pirellulimonas nuda]